MNTFRQPFLETRYFGPTDHKPARIKVINVTSKKYMWISFHCVSGGIDAHEYAARKMLGHGNIYQGELLSCGTDKGYMFTEKNFDSSSTLTNKEIPTTVKYFCDSCGDDYKLVPPQKPFKCKRRGCKGMVS